MNLTVKLFASFAQYLPPEAKKQTMSVDVDEGVRVGQVLLQCGVPLDECRLVIINGITHTNPAFSLEMELFPGDTLAVLPKVH
ncbi:MAG: hypothetical protein ISR45_05305 [Rhodospirillales bacterium]|nr:hypothetical protein [Rhodospirillales bacterium]